MSRKKSPNRIVAEAVEHGFGKGFTVRKNIIDRDEDYIDATSITAREWEYKSTVCPAEWDKKSTSRIREAVTRAKALHTAGWRGERVLVVPKVAPVAEKDFFNRVAPVYSFYEKAGAWVRRVNAALDPHGISVCLAARHAALIAGEIRPHLHLLVMRAPGVKLTAAEVRELIAQELGDTDAVVEPPAPRIAGFIKKPKRLREYVRYLHKYPVTAYSSEGVKADLRDVIDTDPELFLAALAALNRRKSCLIALAG